MAKGGYSGPKYGGSRSGWEKGQKDAKDKNLLITSLVAVGSLLVGFFLGDTRKK